jgi:hypothetical protein
MTDTVPAGHRVACKCHFWTLGGAVAGLPVTNVTLRCSGTGIECETYELSDCRIGNCHRLVSIMI